MLCQRVHALTVVCKPQDESQIVQVMLLASHWQSRGWDCHHRQSSIRSKEQGHSSTHNCWFRSLSVRKRRNQGRLGLGQCPPQSKKDPDDKQFLQGKSISGTVPFSNVCRGATQQWASSTQQWARLTQQWASPIQKWARLTQQCVSPTQQWASPTQQWARLTQQWARLTQQWASPTKRWAAPYIIASKHTCFGAAFLGVQDIVRQTDAIIAGAHSNVAGQARATGCACTCTQHASHHLHCREEERISDGSPSSSSSSGMGNLTMHCTRWLCAWLAWAKGTQTY